ncbi:cytochrome c [Litoreibacter ponti]|uniref:Cytochrome c n=1 Tax=Litoreibacter ponti TaxID=1510457 RepID=A0A2T6BEI8_9RHOB|nr:c-type cytochrome [Litoreibacter ponti]PTX54480.1 cytochrome c [Litoreibacter ponti]
MRYLLKFSLSVAASMVAMGVAADSVGDPERGRQVFKKCASCHMIGADARNRVGPPLNNIMAARAASVADFQYSTALKKAAEDGLHWTPDTLAVFLETPKAMIPKTKMTFRGLKSAEDRIDLIAYLATFSGGSMAAQVDEGFTVSAEVLALEGDMEYGEYLASECTTCHRPDGDNDGIPGITGWETADFVTAIHAYREKHRDNPVMQMITGRLANDEIAALAAYFKSLEN